MTTGDDVGAGGHSGSSPFEAWGTKCVGFFGVVFLAAFLSGLAGFVLYCLIIIWPHPTPAGTPPTNQTAGASAVESSTPPTAELPRASEEGKEPHSVTFFFGSFKLWDEVRLLLIVMLAGALGSLVHALRSFCWYVGNRNLVRSWLAMFILLPLVGTTLAVVFYFVVRGGFFSPQASFKDTSPFGFAALAGLIGMFSQQAVLKLKEVAETMLTRPKEGQDSQPQG